MYGLYTHRYSHVYYIAFLLVKPPENTVRHSAVEQINHEKNHEI